MAVDILTTQQYLNKACGTVGLTKQQCWQYLAGAPGVGVTSQVAANIVCAGGSSSNSIQQSCKAVDSIEGMSIQEHARRF